MKKMRYYDDGGAVGYEEDPKPGVQSDREDKPKKPAKKDKPRTAQSKPRSMSNEEFIEKYKDSPASDRIKEEASKSVNKDKASRTASGTRVDMGGVSFGDPEMTREEQESIAKNLLKGAAAIGSVGAAGSVGPAIRAGQAANRQRIIGRNYEALSQGQRDAAAHAANFAARPRPVQTPTVVDGMKSGGSTGRGGGCEIRGKTKGRMV